MIPICSLRFSHGFKKTEQMQRQTEINEVNLCLLKKNFISCELHFLSHTMILLF